MPSDEFEVPREIGSYTLLERIARARAGTVYRAKQKDGKIVAVRTAGDRTDVATGGKGAGRLNEVSRLLEKVAHPVIPRVLERGKHDDQPFAAFELAPGERLDKVLEEQRLPVAQVVELGRTLARALAAAHAAGVIHTDVCPRSVLFAMGAGSSVRLVGWGASRPQGVSLGKDVPRASVTPPEVDAESNALASPAIDIFGVGAILYEALAFAQPRPRDAALPPALRAPWPPRALNPGVPAAVEAVLLKALEPEPRRRYATANELAQDLDALATGKAPAARRPGLGRALERAARKRPWVAGGATLALALALALGGSSAVLAHSRSERALESLRSFDAALAKGDLALARTSLERAQREDPASANVARAQARLEDAKLDALEHEKATSDARDLARELEAGRAELERARLRAGEVPALAADLGRVAAEARPLDPPFGPEKRALARARAVLEAAAEDEARSLGRAEAAFERALRLAPDDADVRRGLADTALARAAMLGLDRDLEREERARALEAAAVLSDGKVAPATLTVEVEPAGATLELSRDGGRTRTPLAAGTSVAVAPGDVLVTASQPDRRKQAVALSLLPGAQARLRLRLLAEGAVGPDEVALPAAELELPPAPAPLAGQDVAFAPTATARAASPPVRVEPALVARRGVTRGDYGRFLRSLEVADLPRHLPRTPEGTPLFGDSIDDVTKLPHEPIAGITLAAARAYARWAGARVPTRAELWAARANGAEGVLREWTGDDIKSDTAVVVDLRVVRGERDVVGEERLERADQGARDVTFRLARSAPGGS